MASSFASRDDPEYLKHMEDELFKSRQSREEETDLLQSVLSRMDKLEVKQPTTTTMGRGILRTPLKSGLHNEVSGRLGGPTMSPHSLAADFAGLVDPSPSEVINGPLTTVLQQLSVAIDPTPQ